MDEDLSDGAAIGKDITEEEARLNKQKSPLHL